MKLYILDYKDTGLGKDKPWWFKFRMSIGKEAWPNDVLQKEYNGVLCIPRHHAPYIEFKNDSDATLFLLRWS